MINHEVRSKTLNEILEFIKTDDRIPLVLHKALELYPNCKLVSTQVLSFPVSHINVIVYGIGPDPNETTELDAIYPDVVSFEDTPRQSLVIDFMGQEDTDIEGYESYFVDITEEVQNGRI